MVCYKTNRIKAFARGTRGYKHLFACHILFSGDFLKDIIQQGFLGRELARSGVSARKVSAVGLNYRSAAVLQYF